MKQTNIIGHVTLRRFDNNNGDNNNNNNNNKKIKTVQ
jgi:hypothetical protein